MIVRIKDINTYIANDINLDEGAKGILQETTGIGEVTQEQDGLLYVAFVTEDGWLTKVFKPDEVEEVL